MRSSSPISRWRCCEAWTVSRTVDSFSNGTISVKFKTIAGEADRASGILFNVKPNGDWLAVRYNDTENNVALWEFHNGMRRNVRFSDRAHKFMLDRAAWHELKLTIDGADLKTYLDGALALQYTLGAMPGPGRNNGPPNPDLIPANNPVLRPPVQGKIGLWAKTDTTSYFKDYVVSPKKPGPRLESIIAEATVYNAGRQSSPMARSDVSGGT